MNIPFPPVERKSPSFSYLLAACAVITVLTLSLGLIHIAQLRLSFPHVDTSPVQTERIHVPAAIPVPLPPAETVQSMITAEETATTASILVPQINPAPAPPVP